jgi:hypothetical protein
MTKVEKWKNDYRNYDPRCPEVDDTKYLLENNEIMKNFLHSAGFDFSEGNYFHNRAVPNSGILNRPDHRFEDEKIIVEFDGIQHYQNIDIIKKDRKKDEVYKAMEYTIIRIPFFVQPSSETLMHYFNIKGELQLQYPHGFIIYDSTPPTNFCSLGLERFIEEFEKFPETIKKDIVKSFKKLIHLGEKEEYVIPKQCDYLFLNYW